MIRYLIRSSFLVVLWTFLAAIVSESRSIAQTLPEGTSQGDPEVTVELHGRQRSRFRLAMPATEGVGLLSGEMARGARDY